MQTCAASTGFSFSVSLAHEAFLVSQATRDAEGRLLRRLGYHDVATAKWSPANGGQALIEVQLGIEGERPLTARRVDRVEEAPICQLEDELPH